MSGVLRFVTFDVADGTEGQRNGIPLYPLHERKFFFAESQKAGEDTSLKLCQARDVQFCQPMLQFHEVDLVAA